MNPKLENKILKLLADFKEKEPLGLTHCSTLSEYLEIPEKNRYSWGFYRVPYSMAWNTDDEKDEGWTAFYDWVKKNHYWQWFFRKYLIGEFRRFRFIISEKWYYLKCLVWHRHNVVKFRKDPTWCDIDVKIEKTLETLFLDYVEKECGGVISEDDEYSNGVNAKVKRIYTFFKETKPALEAQIDVLMDDLYGHKPKFKRGTLEHNECRQKLEQLESALNMALESNLIEIIKVRQSLWT